MKDLVCNVSISAKRLKKRIVVIVSNFFSIIGLMMMVAEASSEIFGHNGLFDFYRNHADTIIVILIFVCVYKNWDRLEYAVKIKNLPDITITLKVCNVLENKGAVIIPTNSTFDTLMEDEFISTGSVQGQYQTKYFKGRMEELNKKIEIGLEGKTFVELKDGRKHNKKWYPIGTVSRINERNKRAYFLVDSDIDPNGITIDVDALNISQALTNLWNYLYREGNAEPYSIPLIGTGKARAKDVSRNDIVQQIILSFLVASREHKITESLTICIYPGDFDKIGWDELCEFLNYQSQFANVKNVETKPVGIAEKTPENKKYEAEIDKNENRDWFYLSPQKSQKNEYENMILTLLAGNKMKINEVAESIGMSIDETKRIINNLCEDGLIEREKATN
ncbi:MAG: DUF6430 domain-containing protein [Lachnospiraceae bacterium]|nr:DUF6430 domain-containing protein [Lachnospiraceae bacterium]